MYRLLPSTALSFYTGYYYVITTLLLSNKVEYDFSINAGFHFSRNCYQLLRGEIERKEERNKGPREEWANCQLLKVNLLRSFLRATILHARRKCLIYLGGNVIYSTSQSSRPWFPKSLIHNDENHHDSHSNLPHLPTFPIPPFFPRLSRSSERKSTRGRRRRYRGRGWSISGETTLGSRFRRAGDQ